MSSTILYHRVGGHVGGLVEYMVNAKSDGKRDLNRRWIWMHALMAFSYIGLLVAATFVRKDDAKVPVFRYTGYHPNVLSDGVNFEWYTYVVLGISIVFYIVSFVFAPMITTVVAKKGYNPIRWMFFSLSYSIQIMQLTVLVGILDLHLQVAIGGLALSTSILSALFERQIGDKEFRQNELTWNNIDPNQDAALAPEETTDSKALFACGAHKPIITVHKSGLAALALIPFALKWWIIISYLDHAARDVPGHDVERFIYGAVISSMVFSFFYPITLVISAQYNVRMITAPREREYIFIILTFVFQAAQMMIVFIGVFHDQDDGKFAMYEYGVHPFKEICARYG